MRWFLTALTSVAGNLELRELAALRPVYDRRTRRAVRRLVRRGEAAPDAARARLAVAVARDEQRLQRRTAGGWLTALLALIATVFAVVAVIAVVAWDPVLALPLAVGAVACVWAIASHPGRLRRLAAAEQGNLALLAAAGEPYEPAATGQVRPSRAQATAGPALLLLYLVAVLGLSHVWFNELPLTLANVASGAWPGVTIVIGTMLLLRAFAPRA